MIMGSASEQGFQRCCISERTKNEYKISNIIRALLTFYSPLSLRETFICMEAVDEWGLHCWGTAL